jgi:hypothetical protein
MAVSLNVVQLLQDCAYSCRLWITLIKLLYSPLRGDYLTLIFTHLSKYAVGCYFRYGGFPRRTLLGSSLIKLLSCVDHSLYVGAKPTQDRCTPEWPEPDKDPGSSEYVTY